MAFLVDRDQKEEVGLDDSCAENTGLHDKDHCESVQK